MLVWRHEVSIVCLIYTREIECDVLFTPIEICPFEFPVGGLSIHESTIGVSMRIVLFWALGSLRRFVWETFEISIGVVGAIINHLRVWNILGSISLCDSLNAQSSRWLWWAITFGRVSTPWLWWGWMEWEICLWGTTWTTLYLSQWWNITQLPPVWFRD